LSFLRLIKETVFWPNWESIFKLFYVWVYYSFSFDLISERKEVNVIKKPNKKAVQCTMTLFVLIPMQKLKVPID
jgi:hypothetical protein